MIEDPLPHLEDTLLQRELTPDEERALNQWLAGHPEAVEAWRESARFARALRALPDTPVPSNFTARVLAEVRRDAAQSPTPASGSSHGSWAWLRPRFWIPAAGTALVVVAALGGWEWRSQQLQAAFNRDVTRLRTLASVPQEVLEDFDAIQRFGQSSAPIDFELLAALE
ncbi:MAG: anti-sigma factor [Limisphaerales bacterium]